VSFFCINSQPAYAQQHDKKIDEEIIEEQLDEYDNICIYIVETMPEFPGGEEALMKYLAYTVKYPVEASQNRIQGRVAVNFVIDTLGKVQDVKIHRGIHELLDAEAIRVVSEMPDWKPGQCKGKNISVHYIIPINFILEDEDKEEEKEEMPIIVEMKTISKQKTKNISVNVCSIMPDVFFLTVFENDYYLSYSRLLWFKNAKISDIFNVEMIEYCAIRWDALDVDMKIDSLKNLKDIRL
jgi:TonB family protein